MTRLLSRGRAWRLACASIVFALSFLSLLPAALSLEQHGDETQYIWTARYFGSKLARLDLSPTGTDEFVDPGWAPRSFWAICEPMGARFVYAVALAITRADVPALPYSFTDPALQGPETLVPQPTLLIARIAALTSASLGLALIAHRFGAIGALAAAAFLGVPHVRVDLARAWAEGPLLLGYGICALAVGRRWFPAAAGAAAAFKLTALGLWPLVFWQAARSGARFAGTRALAVSLAVWTALTPPTWFAGGPLYLAAMIVYRIREHADQSADLAGPAGVFFPTRYALPIELSLALALSWLAVTAARRLTRTSASDSAPAAVASA